MTPIRPGVIVKTPRSHLAEVIEMRPFDRCRVAYLPAKLEYGIFYCRQLKALGRADKDPNQCHHQYHCNLDQPTQRYCVLCGSTEEK